MFDARRPTADRPLPSIEPIVDADVVPQYIAAPAVVISGDHHHRNSRISQVRQRRKHPKAGSRNHGLPLEPEFEEIAIDDHRPGRVPEIAEKAEDVGSDRWRREAKMRVGKDVSRGWKHGHRVYPTMRPLQRVVPTVAEHSRLASTAALCHFHVPLPPTTIEFRVRYAETDQMGVVYHANYLVWCEMGRTDFIRRRGMSYADIERSGTLLAVSELSARFLGAARYEQLIRVETTMSSIQSRSIVFDYVIVNAETSAKLVTARTSLISVEASGRPKAMPADIRRLFESA
jgi:acyl-CoA thioester hydrolase